MKIVFVTNYYNHHQSHLAEAFYNLVGDDYSFIETSSIGVERIKLGWGGEERPSYVKQMNVKENVAECQALIDDADVVIHGSAPYKLLEPRLKKGKLTFKYSERKYKEGCPILKLPKHFLINSKKYRRYKNFYILCASAYTSADYAKTLTFKNKAYKWGYFTEVKEYGDFDTLVEAKRPASILWVSRLIELKHPEAALQVARRLKADGYDFELNIIGIGPLDNAVKSYIDTAELNENVHMLGSMTPDMVREHMEQSEIFLFNSDRREGWGAVLNESMNSGCAVVASHAIGSVPFLLKDGENGFIYKDGDIDDLYSKVKYLLDNPDERKNIAQNAYLTMKNEWNAENAAKKFIEQVEVLMSGEEISFIHKDGVCSKSEILSDNWIYKTNKKKD